MGQVALEVVRLGVVGCDRAGLVDVVYGFYYFYLWMAARRRRCCGVCRGGHRYFLLELVIQGPSTRAQNLARNQGGRAQTNRL